MVAVIAEDDADTRELIRLVLEQSGFEVVLAEDGTAAIAAVREHNPAAHHPRRQHAGHGRLRRRQAAARVQPDLPDHDHLARLARSTSSAASRPAPTTTWSSRSAPASCGPAPTRCCAAPRYSDQSRAEPASPAARQPRRPPEVSWAAAAAREFRESMDGVPAAAEGEARPQPRLLPEAPTTARPAPPPARRPGGTAGTGPAPAPAPAAADARPARRRPARPRPLSRPAGRAGHRARRRRRGRAHPLRRPEHRHHLGPGGHRRPRRWS